MPHFSGLELVLKRELAVSAAYTMVKNAFKSFGTIRKKFLLLKNTKNARYVRSLGKKPHFGTYKKAKRGVARGKLPSKCSPEAQKDSNPSGISDKMYMVYKSLRFFR